MSKEQWEIQTKDRFLRFVEARYGKRYEVTGENEAPLAHGHSPAHSEPLAKVPNENWLWAADSKS